METQTNTPTGPIRAFLSELRSRRVFHVAGVYAVVSWLVIQIANTIQPHLNLPEWTVTFIIVLAALGFPIALVLTWAFEITPQGVRRTESTAPDDAPAPSEAHTHRRALAFFGIGILVALVGFGLSSRYLGDAAAERFERSIAVLPFDNLAGASGESYFSDGITEDLLTQLAMVEDLSVISRTSVMRYKDSDKPVPQIARELGVAYVLDGSVRRAGDRVRINASLIDTRADDQVWAKTYDRDLDDIFAVQSEVALRITESLQASLSPEEQERIERAPTADPVAYDLYLRAGELMKKSRADNETAAELLRQAIRMDSTFAAAYARLGTTFMYNVHNYGLPLAWADSGLAAARRALEIDPELPAAHVALGSNLWRLGRREEAGAAYRRALELSPNSGRALNNLAVLENAKSRFVEAVRLYREAHRVDPTNAVPPANLAFSFWLLGDRERMEHWRAIGRPLGYPLPVGPTLRMLDDMIAGRLDTARARADSLIVEMPENLIARILMVRTAGMAGDWEEARRWTERVYRRAPDAVFPADGRSVRVEHAHALLHTGDTARATELLDEALERAHASVESGTAPAQRSYGEIAAIHAIRDESDEAIGWLERAYEAGLRGAPLLAIDPAYAGLRDDPRFQRLLDRMRADLADMRRQIAAEAAT